MLKINKNRLKEISFCLLWIGFYFAYTGANNENYIYLYLSFALFGLACLFAIV